MQTVEQKLVNTAVNYDEVSVIKGIHTDDRQNSSFGPTQVDDKLNTVFIKCIFNFDCIVTWTLVAACGCMFIA